MIRTSRFGVCHWVGHVSRLWSATLTVSFRTRFCDLCPNTSTSLFTDALPIPVPHCRDRRSLRGDVPAGVLVGHTEGLTYVASKGDGRYCISNGKDQSMKLWDLRRMTSHKDFEQIERLDLPLFNVLPSHNLCHRRLASSPCSEPGHLTKQNRTSNYPGDAPAHPNDCSVMTYRGHNVVRTLIRCHFSPQHSTGQRYLYTGCADGKIHVSGVFVFFVLAFNYWLTPFSFTPVFQRIILLLPTSIPKIYSLDGTVRQVLDAQKAVDNICGRPRRQRTSGLGYYGYSGYGESDITCVRDVSWHPHLPIIMSTSWSGARKHAGIILRHGWEEEAGGA
ncbi:hypothetical protein BC936DRAFT_147120 [Jimgerdemannia flammicorona]|uniref:Uncharacterized protein n=1 Tax=Jimgerdemannia flammicorona TaxID=994334 RepID=A0A433D643_9FUNG|nr:hypothetical protein BC936DRAFT_147120 [Jimgerdemannia flammicorona]